MKIVYCIDEINGSGGMESITIVKANELSRKKGNIVYIVVAYLRGGCRHIIDGAVRVVDLKVRYYDDAGYGRIRDFFFRIKKRMFIKRN